MKIAVYWFRCDLRLSDNTALHAALAAAETVVPIFIFDPKILESEDVSANQAAFMIECLGSLEKDVARAGSKLIFRHGRILDEMETVLRESRAEALFFNRDYEPYARERDAAVTKMARARGVEVRSFGDSVIQEFDRVLKADGKPYTVFTPYRRKWETVAVARCLPLSPFGKQKQVKVQSLPLPSPQKLGFSISITLPAAGEKAAEKRLNDFIAQALPRYDRDRNVPSLTGTSGLSPHLRLGTISPRIVVAAVQRAQGRHKDKAAETYISELAWRDFYKQILWHFPHVAKGAFRPQYDQLKWSEDERLFAAWCEGRTGYPLVDAGMRQLNSTGWMHNRMRMVTATFLSKDLQISWQWGERYFMQKLLDADLSSNNGGWQWCAGTGTDAQPWFRIFNPISQALKFDPQGKYIHRYVKDVDQRSYPAPIVDHARERLKSLALFRAVRSQAAPKA